MIQDQEPKSQPKTTALAALQSFFALLYPEVDDGYLVLSRPHPTRRTRQGKAALVSTWCNLAQTSWEHIAEKAAPVIEESNLYFGVVLQQPTATPNPWRRGTNATAYIVPGLWCDLDLAYGQHAASTLPATDAEALDFLSSLPAPPSLLVHSGGGMYGYWLFKEPYRLTTEAEHTRISHLAAQFAYTLVNAGTHRGWTLDAVGDLARVLRPPGTVNHKYGTGVEVLHAAEARYNPSDFDWLLDLPEPTRTTHAGAPIAGQPDVITVAEHYGTTLEHRSKTELAGPHPQHGSSTGDNFNVNVAKGLWHCWRHGTGGDALALIAVCEGLLTCEDMRAGALRGATFKNVIDLANAHFQAGISLDAFQRRNGQGTAPGPQASEAAPHAQTGAERPDIYITTDITSTVDQAQAAVLALPGAPPVYQRARTLCLIATGGPPPKWLRRPEDLPLIVRASPTRLWEILGQAATWWDYDKRKKDYVEALPPHWGVETLLARTGWSFPVLESLVYSPTLRPDGSLLDRPGYDPETGLYLALHGTPYPALPARPTVDEARTALGDLQEAVQDFPFATPAHFSATLAAIVSLVCRFAILGNVPLFAIRANTRGSGKSLLADVISIIGTGRAAPRWPQVTDEEEERKRLLTVALAGYPVIHIDNVTRPLGSPALDLALTSPSFSDRILGKQESLEAPLSLVWLASGNNMQFKGDTARRIVPIDLDPKMEKPEERTDFHVAPLLPWVQHERPRLAMAALTILRAYFVVGCPAQQVTPMGSFDEWSTLVRQALIWAGEADPNEGRKEIEAQSDTSYERLAILLATWAKCYPPDDPHTTGKTLADVRRDLQRHAALPAQPANDWNALQEALGAFDPKYDGTSFNAHLVGQEFRKFQGRTIDGHRFVTAGEFRRAQKWTIESV
jgi:hypothetical protein